MAKKKDPFKEVIDKILPNAKKELEKGLVNAKKMLAKGEEYLKELSKKGVKETKKISLSLKREKAYYGLGKAAANITTEKWESNKKISAILKEIKSLDGQIKKLK